MPTNCAFISHCNQHGGGQNKQYETQLKRKIKLQKQPHRVWPGEKALRHIPIHYAGHVQRAEVFEWAWPSDSGPEGCQEDARGCRAPKMRTPMLLAAHCPQTLASERFRQANPARLLGECLKYNFMFSISAFFFLPIQNLLTGC